MPALDATAFLKMSFKCLSVSLLLDPDPNLGKPNQCRSESETLALTKICSTFAQCRNARRRWRGGRDGRARGRGVRTPCSCEPDPVPTPGNPFPPPRQKITYIKKYRSIRTWRIPRFRRFKGIMRKKGGREGRRRSQYVSDRGDRGFIVFWFCCHL